MHETRQLFLLIGQSNMAGRGYTADVPAIRDERILMFRNSGWQPAAEPLHDDKPDIAGVGPGMSFAAALLERKPACTVGLIPCAVGGTPLSRWMPGADLYARAVAFARAAGAAGCLDGILWHQGEGDSGDPALAASYGERLSDMLCTLRQELAVPAAPVVAGELGPFMRQRPEPNHAETVNAELRRLETVLPAFGCAASDGLAHNGDMLHFNAVSQREFGRRYAAVFLRLAGY